MPSTWKLIAALVLASVVIGSSPRLAAADAFDSDADDWWIGATVSGGR